MSAAVVLARAGKPVLIYEREATVGGSRQGDFEGLENWIFPTPVPEFLSACGFDPAPLVTHPVHNFQVHIPTTKPFRVASRKPFFYLVRRGVDHDSLDQVLFRHCHKQGVRFIFSHSADPREVDIVATGPIRAAAYIEGGLFKTALPDQVHLLLGHPYAPRGYAYLIITAGEGTLACAYTRPARRPFQATRDYFNALGLGIVLEKKFASRGSFRLPGTGPRQPLVIGEAGGYQDFLFGFGMRLGMLSGRMAALVILKQGSQARRMARDLTRVRRLSFLNRLFYERLDNVHLARQAEAIARSADPLALLSRAYSWNWVSLTRWLRLKRSYALRPT